MASLCNGGRISLLERYICTLQEFLRHCTMIQLGGHQPAQKPSPNREHDWPVNISRHRKLEPLTVLDTSLRLLSLNVIKSRAGKRSLKSESQCSPLIESLNRTGSGKLHMFANLSGQSIWEFLQL